MAIQRDRDSGRQATAWLATCCVCAMGIALCSAIIVAFSKNPNQSFLCLFGGVAGFWILLWLLNPGTWKRKPAESDVEWLIRSNSLENVMSTGRYKRKPAYRERLGQNRPPTLDEIRELAQTSNNNWVPSNYPKRS